MAPLKKKIRKSVPEANAYIKASYNNLLVTLTDLDGAVLVRASAGGCGFKGTKKSTPYAGQVAAEKAMETATGYGIQKLNIFVRGIGPGREQAIRGLGLRYPVEFRRIVDVTPLPHNGTRAKRRRRV